jgi:hypothetical protein
MRVVGSSVLLSVRTAGARFPVRVDPFIQQGSKLTDGTLGEDAGAGSAVALSADGSTAVVGVPGDDSNLGSVLVFVRSGSGWVEQGPKLSPSDAEGSVVAFGGSVAVSADGNTVAIGGPVDNDGAGAVWVFTRSGSTWSQDGAKLTPDDETGAGQFGQAVSLTADGATLLVGGYHDDGDVGAAWVFTTSGSAWVQDGTKLTGSGENGAGFFGGAVSLSADGSTAAIGGFEDSSVAGAVWMFTRSGSAWSQQAKLTSVAHGGTPGGFGGHVVLSADGNTALISEVGYGRGAVWVFQRVGSVWRRARELTVSVTRSQYFGVSDALSADGDTILVGTPNNGSDYSGKAWVFRRQSGNTWVQLGTLTASDESGGDAAFGDSVAVSGDGTRALVGGAADNAGRGAVWVFDRTGAPCTYANTVEASSGLSGFWRLGESAGRTAVDSSQSGHNGSYAGGFSLGQPGSVLGDSNTSVSLNGSTGRVTLPSLGTASSWTIEGWSNLDASAANSPHGYNALYASGTGARLLIEPTGVYADDSTAGASAGHIDPGTDSNIGVWTFWALVRNGSTMTLYRNGTQIGTSSLSGHGPTNLNGTIGAQGSGYPLHGRVDEVAAYTSALSATALQSQYSCSGWG